MNAKRKSRIVVDLITLLGRFPLTLPRALAAVVVLWVSLTVAPSTSETETRVTGFSQAGGCDVLQSS